MLPVGALAKLKAKLGDELVVSLTDTGLLLHSVKRSPSINRKKRRA